MMAKYKPTEVDLVWAKGMMNLIKHEGILAYPNTGLIYLVDHNKKVLTLQNPELLFDFANNETHERTKLVFQQLGYKVAEKTDC